MSRLALAPPPDHATPAIGNTLPGSPNSKHTSSRLANILPKMARQWPAYLM